MDRVGVAGCAVALPVADPEAKAGVVVTAFAGCRDKLEFSCGDVFIRDALAQCDIHPGWRTDSARVVLQHALAGQAGDDKSLQGVCRRCCIGVGECEIAGGENLCGVFIHSAAGIGPCRYRVVEYRRRELPRVAGDAVHATNVAIDAVGLRGCQQDHAHLRSDGVAGQAAFGIGKADEGIGIELEADEAIDLAIAVQIIEHGIGACGTHIDQLPRGQNGSLDIKRSGAW